MTIDPRCYEESNEQPYPLLSATLSGAHLYGFPSPDSDFDIRGAHILARSGDGQTSLARFAGAFAAGRLKLLLATCAGLV